jgi:type II secretory pathway predicted ATPase ExeA
MLVGQPQLESMLKRPDLKQFAQRVEFDFHIKPLENAEVQKYIEYRLEIAGRKAPLFANMACARIAQVSHGIPRIINILCDTALVYGYAAEAEHIDVVLVDEMLMDKAKYGALPYPR